MTEKADNDYLVKLRQVLEQHFNESELRTLCFDLHIDYESLPGHSKADKARELVAYFERRSNTRELGDAVQRERPEVELGELSQKVKHRDYGIKILSPKGITIFGAKIDFSKLKIPVPFIIGFIIGVLVLALLVIIGQPPALIGPLVHPAVSATIAAFPAPTSAPELRVEMINMSESGKVMPTVGNFEYRLTTRQTALIRVVEPQVLSEYVRWKITHPNPLGEYEESYETGSEIPFIALDLAPDDEEGKVSIVEVCEADVEFRCLPGGLSRVYLIRTILGEEK